MQERVEQLDHARVISVELGTFRVILLEGRDPSLVVDVFGQLLQDFDLVEPNSNQYAASM